MKYNSNYVKTIVNIFIFKCLKIENPRKNIKTNNFGKIVQYFY